MQDHSSRTVRDSDPASRAAAPRLLNFRSLAGTPGDGGRRLRTGCLLRAGHFDALEPDQVTSLRLMGLAGVCDLRSVAEQARMPSALPGAGFGMLIPPPPSDPSTAMTAVADPAAAPDDVRAAMLALYAAMPETLAPAFGALFEAALACRGAVLVQCALGKDRTGAAMALLLAAAGVPRAAILADYLQSNGARDALYAALVRRNPGRTPPPDAMVAPMLMADPAYLQAFWARLDADHGGEAGYLSGTLGLGADAIGALRARWLG